VTHSGIGGFAVGQRARQLRTPAVEYAGICGSSRALLLDVYVEMP